MRDLRPIVILLVYFVALAVVAVLAGFDSASPAPSRQRVRHQPPKIAISQTGADTATIDQPVTYEIEVKAKSSDTTGTIIKLSDTLIAYAGASLEIVGAEPKFENTEAIPYGGTKINWGAYQVVSGDTLKFKLHLKSKRKGTLASVASIKLPDNTVLNSGNLATMVNPPVEATATVGTTQTATGTLVPAATSLLSGLSTSGSGMGAATSPEPSSATTGASAGSSEASQGSSPASVASPSKASQPSTDTGVFTDVKKSDWFYPYVRDVSAWGLINGDSDNTFRPAASMTRAEFLAAVTRGLGPVAGTSHPFKDVKAQDWFYRFVLAAYNHGLVDGTPNAIFAPNEKMTREDAIIIGVRAAQLPVETDTETISTWLQGFSDKGEISEIGRPYVATAVKYGLLWRYGDAKFNPKDPVTRAETAALLFWAFFESHTALSEAPNVTSTPTAAASNGTQ